MTITTQLVTLCEMQPMSWASFLGHHVGEMLSLLVALACSGFFSASETAMFNLSRGQVHQLKNSGVRGRLVASLLARPEQLLNTILLANTLANTIFAAVVAVMILDMHAMGLPGWVAAVVSFVPIIVFILLGEVGPKMIAMVAGQRLALLNVVPLSFLHRSLTPLLRAMDAVIVPLTRLLAPRADHGRDISAGELSAIMSLSAKRGIIGHDASELMQEIVTLTDLRVRDIMIPRVDVVAYDLDDPPAGLVELFNKTHFRRIPVYQRDLDGVIGVVDAKNLLLNPNMPLRSLATKAPFVPEAANVEKLLLQLRVTRSGMAFVVDEYGGTAGIVTMHDLLEQIVGEIPVPDSKAEAPAVQKRSDREYLVDGDLAVHEWADAFHIDLSGRRISTVGGFVTSLLGRLPRVGDLVTYRNLRFHVDSMRGRRIEKLRLELLEETP